MEMTFPSTRCQMGGASPRRDYRALLSVAISRQASSPTAAAMLLARCDSPAVIARDNSISSRARYFAGHYATEHKAIAPYGAFFLGTAEGTEGSINYDQAVYQDGSILGKPKGLKNNQPDDLAAKLGQEN
jgi:hypothetical protein